MMGTPKSSTPNCRKLPFPRGHNPTVLPAAKGQQKRACDESAGPGALKQMEGSEKLYILGFGAGSWDLESLLESRSGALIEIDPTRIK